MNKHDAESVIKETIAYANQEIEKTKKQTRRLLLAVILVFSAVIVGIFLWKPKKTLDIFVVGTAISDMNAAEIKEENGSSYVLLKNTNLNNTDGISHYFNEGRWVKVSESLDQGSIQKDKTYSSLTVRFMIPKETAIAHEWISSDTLSIDMFLRDKECNPDYLWVVDVME